MKKTLALSLLIPLALVCSCEKQDSIAEQQLAQRKTELDAREKALDEREKALAEREKIVVRPRVAPVPRTAPEPRQRVAPDLQGLMRRFRSRRRLFLISSTGWGKRSAGQFDLRNCIGSLSRAPSAFSTHMAAHFTLRTGQVESSCPDLFRKAARRW